MAYNVPTFNLTCRIYHSLLDYPLAFTTSVCNLALGRRISMATGIPGTVIPASSTMWLLLPAGTDIIDAFTPDGPSYVEAPALSGRWYKAVLVDDAGKGFSNEYRFALIEKTLDIAAWPDPIP